MRCCEAIPPEQTAIIDAPAGSLFAGVPCATDAGSTSRD
jgi:hypothetical protein